MKISGYNLPELPGSKPSATPAPKAAPTALAVATSSASDSGVAVVMTSTARAMGKGGLNNTPVIDTKKVDAMKAAIANGSFSVDANAIANKLLNSAADFLQVSPK